MRKLAIQQTLHPFVQKQTAAIRLNEGSSAYQRKACLSLLSSIKTTMSALQRA